MFQLPKLVIGVSLCHVETDKREIRRRLAIYDASANDKMSGVNMHARLPMPKLWGGKRPASAVQAALIQASVRWLEIAC
jgi:hypothetical protein